MNESSEAVLGTWLRVASASIWYSPAGTMILLLFWSLGLFPPHQPSLHGTLPVCLV